MREMIDTNNDCLTSIPVEWQHPRLKYYCKISNGSDPQTDGNIPVYGSGKEVIKYCGEYKEGPAILLGRKGTLDNPRYVDGKFWNVDTAMDAYPINGINPRFLFFVTKILDIQRYATSTAKPSMTQGDYYSMPIPVPSRDEQDSIVSFIDSKCSAIDEAIERHKKIIEKLEEYKKVTVLNAVNGSGDKWVTIRVKFLIDSIESGKNYYGGVGEKYNIYGGGKPLGLSDEYNAENCIIVGRVGANCGQVTFVPSRAWATDNALVVKTSQNLKYMFYLFNATNFRDNDEASAQPLVTGGKIKNKTVCFPLDFHMQERIVLYLDEVYAKVNKMLYEHNQIISKLEEYRKSIIYNAVTGKIDCREVAQ